MLTEAQNRYKDVVRLALDGAQLSKAYSTTYKVWYKKHYLKEVLIQLKLLYQQAEMYETVKRIGLNV